jgi:hypothetical protein
MQTINADLVLAYFGVVILGLIALLVDDHVGVWGYKR